MMKRSLENAAPLLFFLAAFAGCNPMAPQSTIESSFHPGIEPHSTSISTGTPFSNSWPFDFGTTASYSYDTTKIDFTGGVCRLTANDQLDNDNSAAGFAGGTHTSTTWDATNSYLRLSQTGTPTNTAALDSSWTPQWANLVHYWKLDGNWNDSIGSMTATPQNGATFATGKIGSQAADFDGTNDYLVFGDDASVDFGSGEFTVSIWAYLDVPCGNSVTYQQSWLLTKWRNGGVNPGDNEWNISGCGGATISQFRFAVEVGSTSYSVSATSNWVPNTWYMLTGVRRGDTIYLYVNGTEQGSFNLAAGAVVNNVGRVLETGTSFNLAQYTNGKIDEVAIWKGKGLTTAEVRTIYERQAATYSGTYTSRVMDAYAIGQSWTTMSWVPTLPFLKPLPDYSGGAIQNETSTDYSSLVGSTGSTGANDLMDGIVGLWHFDETAATAGAGPNDFADDSGAGHPGESVSVSFGANGLLGKAIALDGTASHLTYDHPAKDVPPFTVCIWAFPSILDGTVRYLVSNGGQTGGSHGFSLRVNASNQFDFRTGYNNITGAVASATTAKAESWSHVCGSWDGTTTANSVILYVNGVQVAAGTAGAGATNTTVHNLFVGRPSSAAGFYFGGMLDELAVWDHVLHPNEVMQLYRRGANRVKYQVRVCTTADCSDDATGANWKGPDGTNQTYFSELNNNTAALAMTGEVKKSLPSMLFSDFTSPVGTSRYFQYRTILESDDSSTNCNYGGGATWCSPEVKSVTVDPVHYANDSPTIIGKTGVAFSSLSSFAQTLGTSCSSGVTYNLGIGASSAAATWYYWNGAAWTAANGTAAQSNTAAVVNTNASSFAAQAGTGTVYFKAFLGSSGSSACELDAVDLTGTQ